MSDSRPIGVFDSGVGGLTVLREMRRQLPAERLLYVADLAHFPYGPRPQREVRALALDIIAMLVAMDTKLVVVACNTATAAALHTARERFDIPIIGVIAPGAQAAAAATRTGRVAVLSTEGTRASGEYVHAVKEANPGVLVLSEAAPDLVEIVEDGDADTPRADAALRPVLGPSLRMGCRHAGARMHPLPAAPPGAAAGDRVAPVAASSTALTPPRRGCPGSSRSTISEAGEGVTAPPVEVMVTADPARFSRERVAPLR